MVSTTIRKGERRRRATALIVAISVLAILTVLVMGLAASQQNAKTLRAQNDLRDAARGIARTGLDAALALLAAVPGGLAEPREIDYPVAEGACRLSAKPADPQDPVYSGKFIAHRPGDVLVTVRAEAQRGRRSLRLDQEYLVNADASNRRCVRLGETITR